MNLPEDKSLLSQTVPALRASWKARTPPHSPSGQSTATARTLLSLGQSREQGSRATGMNKPHRVVVPSKVFLYDSQNAPLATIYRLTSSLIHSMHASSHSQFTLTCFSRVSQSFTCCGTFPAICSKAKSRD